VFAKILDKEKWLIMVEEEDVSSQQRLVIYVRAALRHLEQQQSRMTATLIAAITITYTYCWFRNGYFS